MTRSTKSFPRRNVTRRLAFAGGVAVTLVCAPLSASAEEMKPKIIGGQLEHGFGAVGALINGGDWFCTGTLIAPRVVLTAAHCLADFSAQDKIEFYLGDDATQLSSGRLIEASTLHVFPDYDPDTVEGDIGILVLAQDAGVTPAVPNFDTLSNGIIGQNATFVGFGITEGNTMLGGQKRSVDMAISGLSEKFVENATPGRNTCSGDSGGPTFLHMGGQLRLISTTSYGDAACVETGYNTRVDLYADYIQPFLDGSALGSPTSLPSANAGADTTGDDTTAWDSGSDDPSSVDGADDCEAQGWYGDGVCDDFCAKPDPDCDGTNDGTGADWTGDDTGSNDWNTDPNATDLLPDDGSDPTLDDATDDGGTDATGVTDPSKPSGGQPVAGKQGDGCEAGGGELPGALGLGVAGMMLLRRRRTAAV